MAVAPEVRYPGTPLWNLRRFRAGLADPLRFLQELARQGDVVPFALGRRRAVLLNHPDHVSAVLVAQASRFPKGRANSRARRLLGDGLLTADAAPNAERRKALQPLFARRRAEAWAAIVAAHAERMCAGWRDGGEIDLSDALGRLTFGIAGDAIVGADVSGEFEGVKRALAAATAALDPLVALVAPLGEVARARAELRRAVARVMAQAPRETVAGAGLQADDVLTLLLAGHDTITSALTWAWALVLAHPEVEGKLRAELAGLGERRLDAADAGRLEYTRAVVAETLRLYPPAWVLAREADGAHRFGGVDVPDGAIVLVSQYLLHRDARFFDRPLAFDPDRWLGVAPRERFAYFPFGAGARACIGESFAWLEGVLVLATVARRWRMRPAGAPIPDVEPRITLRPRQPFVVSVARS